MKKLLWLILIILGTVAVAFAPSQSAASSEGGTVTGSGRGTFSERTTFSSVELSSIDIGTGVFIEPEGSATGPFSAVLSGKSLLGQPQQIVVDGNVLQGARTGTGQAYLSGVASVSFGNGLPAFSGVPFTVTTTADSFTLTVDSRTLPQARLSPGSITIE